MKLTGFLRRPNSKGREGRGRKRKGREKM